MYYEMGKTAALAAMGLKDTDAVKKKIRYAGMAVHLDQPKGTTREYRDDKGKLVWSHEYPHDYGFFPKVMGNDGDHLDTYVGPHKPADAPTVFVLDKMKKDGKTFDEHKVFMGFKSKDEVQREVLDGWASQAMVGKIRTMSLADLKAQVSKGKFTPPTGKTAAYAGIQPQHINKILAANQRLGTVSDTTTALRKAREELDEFEAELHKGDHAKAVSELGDTLLAVHLMAGRYAQQYGKDPHAEAHASTMKVVNRLGMIEKAVNKGTSLQDAVAAAKKAHP